MYLNKNINADISVDFDEVLYKNTAIDEQRKLAISRILKKGISEDQDKFYLTQIRPINKIGNTVDLIKFYGNYKLYYKYYAKACYH